MSQKSDLKQRTWLLVYWGKNIGMKAVGPFGGWALHKNTKVTAKVFVGISTKLSTCLNLKSRHPAAQHQKQLHK